VTDKKGDLRRHARHCRDMAHRQSDERMRIILQTMASEFDEQADAIALSELKVPRA